MIQLSLILPVHNEEHIITPVYNLLKKTIDYLGIEYEMILIENGSSDKSLSVIKQLAKQNKNTKVLVAPIGYGSAIQEGLAASKGTYVCYMPSDGQVDPNVIPQLWKKIQLQKWDVVKVRRIGRESILRLIISYAFSICMVIFFGTPPWDINGDPRIFPRKYLKHLDLQYKDSFIDAEFSIKAKLLQWKVLEIETKSLDRFGGKSTRSIHTFLEFFKNMWEFKTGNTLLLWRKKVSI